MTDRALKIGLAASVALNVVLLGAGGFAAWKVHDFVSDIRKSGGPMEAARTLQEADRKAFRQRLRGARALAQPERDMARKDREAAAAVASRDPFDKPQFLKLLDDARMHDSLFRAKMDAAAADALAGLKPEERTRIVRAFTHIPNKPGSNADDHGPDDRGGPPSSR